MFGFKENSVAVLINDLHFSYSKCDPILNGINLTVNKTHIYGLLGPSGCGKTTLLNCILGRRKPNKGYVKVFGAKPGTSECGIPGAGVGYMPQELGLYMEFTIEEILNYFGKIYSMNKSVIREKTKELSQLLRLPENNKPIRSFSGGQQKRISLSCALIHSPPLLILDEPTVGTDLFLKKIIFSHLRSLCLSGITIILTTHYIEETRNADVVAFLRNGKILIEENPNVLLNKYESNSLEEVFLNLCNSEEFKENCNQNNNRIEAKVETNIYCYENKAFYVYNQTNDNPSIEIGTTSSRLPSTLKQNFWDKFSALLQKNYKKMLRNWFMFLSFILMPTIQLALLLFSVGDGPIDMKIAVFNEEVVNNRSESWGQLFINSLSDKTFVKIYFNSFEEAFDSVSSGHTFAVIDINERFTNALKLRFLYGSDADEELLEESQIRVQIDWSNQMVALHIERYLYEALTEFNKEIVNKSNLNLKSFKIPLSFEEPVYGFRSESLRDFILPGVLVLLSFYDISYITATLIIEDQKDGILERSIVSGVTALDFLLSHFLTQILNLCLETLFLISFPLLLFGKRISNSLPLILSLILSEGLCGTAFGLFLPTITFDGLYMSVIVVTLFVFSGFMAGVFWPTNNMPLVLQYFNQYLPITISSNSLRSILYREWTLTHYEVYIGFISTYVWLSIFFILALIFFRKIFK